MSQQLSVDKIMTKELITFRKEEDIWEVINVIVKNKISGAPVVNDRGELIGMLSEADCIRVVLEDRSNQPGGLGIVADYMSHNVRTIKEETTLIEVASYFAHSNFRRFPVLSETGRLVGQVSRSDVLKAISKLQPELNLVPDSWKHRMPKVPPTKQGRYSENA